MKEQDKRIQQLAKEGLEEFNKKPNKSLVELLIPLEDANNMQNLKYQKDIIQLSELVTTTKQLLVELRRCNTFYYGEEFEERVNDLLKKIDKAI